MKLILDGAQQMLAKTAADFMIKNDAILRLRELREADDALGYSPLVWKEMADLGWTAIPFAEDDGGLGLGLAEVVLITEALGRGLAPEPYISAVVLAGSLLGQADDEQKAAWVEPTITGEKRVAVAYQESGSRYDLAHVETMASATGEGWELNGEKIQGHRRPYGRRLDHLRAIRRRRQRQLGHHPLSGAGRSPGSLLGATEPGRLAQCRNRAPRRRQSRPGRRHR